MRNFYRKACRRARQWAAIHAMLLSRQRRARNGARALVACAAVAAVAFALLVTFASPASAADLGGALAPLSILPFALGLTLPRPMIQRLDPKVGYNGEGSVAVFELPRAMLYQGVVLSGNYTDTLSVAATSVKTYGVPIDRIDVVAENGITLHSIRPTDLVREKQTEAGQPLASMLVPPTVVTATANAGSHQIPLTFQLDDCRDGQDFMLPAWRFEQVQVLVYFTNTHANIYTGGTGVVTYQSLSLSYRAVVDLPARMIADPNSIVRETELLLRSFKERDQAAVADQEFLIELPRSHDILRVYIITEDASRDPVATILNDVSLVENGQVRRLSKVPAAALRSIGSEWQQATLPTGWHVIDFTQPSDTHKAALEAGKLNSLDLLLNVAAVAGKVRAVVVRKAA